MILVFMVCQCNVYVIPKSLGRKDLGYKSLWPLAGEPSSVVFSSSTLAPPGGPQSSVDGDLRSAVQTECAVRVVSAGSPMT